MKKLDATLLARCTGSTPFRAAPYVEALRGAMALFAIDSVTRAAPFLANVAVETQYLNAVEENLNYTTAERLREIFPSLFVPAKGGKYRAEDYVRNPSGLSRIKYAGFHGRGLMHLTWQDAYKAAGDSLGHDYVNNPALVMEPGHAALTACWFWTEYKRLNNFAEIGELREIRRRINGPAMLGLAEVAKYRDVAALALAGE